MRLASEVRATCEHLSSACLLQIVPDFFREYFSKLEGSSIVEFCMASKSNKSFVFHAFILVCVFHTLKATTLSLSEPRFHLIATSVGNLALFAGGQNYNGTGISSTVDIYNYTSNTWSTANLSQGRYNLVATTIGDLALFAGGYNSSYRSDRVDIYNYTSNTWSTANLSQPRSDLAATSVGNLALFGGGSNATTVSDIVDIYNYTSNTWSVVSLSQPRMYLAATSLYDLAFFAGGYQLGPGESDRVDIYNFTSNTWSTANLSLARESLAATSIGNLALFAGGFGSNRLDIYDYALNTWSFANLSDGQSGAVATTLGNLAFFATSSVQVFNLTSNTWSTTTLCVPRSLLAATTVMDLAIFGGGNTNQPSAQVDMYNLTTNQWIRPHCQPGTETIVMSTPTLQCSNCSQGSYSNISDASTCSSCPGGTYANETGTVQCSTCPPGSYCHDGGCPTCSLCQAGTVPNQEATNCTSCPPGTYSHEGSPSCTQCPAGTASGATAAINSDTCQTCGAGLYSSEGASQCSTCPKGTTSKPGSSSCSKTKENSLKIAVAVISVAFGLAMIGIIIALVRVYGRRIAQPKSDIELVDIGTWTLIENIEVKERLGGGNFGDVFKGIWNGTTTVALKKLKSKDHLEEFAKEADVLQALNHPNIVRCLGIHTAANGDQFIVVEYLSKGSVDVLLAVEKQSIHLVDVLAMAKDAAAGMLYLEQQKIVHRDLALRNLLAAPSEQGKYTVKVSDFGLSRQIKEEGFYMKPEATGIPIRWCAPEVLEKGMYTSKSDVWSFGIMLWELFTYGKIPYPGMTNAEVMQKVIAGYRLVCPEGCPQEMYELMERCWHHRPEARPGFKEIYEKIESICNSVHFTGEAENNLQSNLQHQQRDTFRNNYNNETEPAITNNSNYNSRTSFNIQPANSNSNYN